MVSVHAFIDICTIFRLELVHELAPGLSKILRECPINCLSDPSGTIVAIKYWYGQPNSVESTKRSVLTLTNELLKIADRRSCSKKLRINFCKNEVEKWVSGAFEETELLETLEKADYKQTDLVSSFLAEIVDVCCKSVRKAAVTEAFSLRVDLVTKTFTRKRDPF